MQRIPAGLVLALFLPAALLVALPAHAASCAWSAKMEEDEGGSVMMASVCGGPKGDANLMLACFDRPVLSYDLGAAGGQLEPGIRGSFTFKAGGKSVTKKLVLEAMYNYFTTDLSGPADPLLALLRGKGEVRVSADKYGEVSFPLAGSSAAIGTVLAECGKGSDREAD
ncbi:hypothetical protein RFM26_10050 [Mesorhizobium sp. VK23B]|uniref:Uncharacterized protein n=1 Tax=Mesorhizobium dulcispinae TaxID=3072316 RepID=A0ABU4XDZ3_9HYPH|nr:MULTISPECIES: hypothetical protein [unclassified Mesorhizobium]MDX8466021.1 hypothetical protein [Mesorhizobium sp. VK23B]MDX8471832.1 hypothetical protein [Mesorhizobium sp. VK23A]MDX8520743.1 hypothetical protein [Mesorhizobium sp. VK23D]